MIVPALHLEAATRGIDVSTPDKMRIFAESKIIRQAMTINETYSSEARALMKMRGRAELAESRADALQQRIDALETQRLQFKGGAT